MEDDDLEKYFQSRAEQEAQFIENNMSFFIEHLDGHFEITKDGIKLNVP